MTEALLYQTSDPDFADRAVDALQHAGVPCYRLGQGFAAKSPVPTRYVGLGISIYIKHEEDYAKATEIIVKLGAVVEPRITLPFWVTWILYAILALVACIAVVALAVRWT